MKKIHKVFIILLIILFTFPFTSLEANTNRIIRVGYTLIEGLFMKDEEDNYYGYDYDYLKQIAQYTGWDYEFVEADGDKNTQITTLMEMLKKGEIDLLADTRYFESLIADYDFSNEPYGSSYNVLAVKNDSELMDINSLIAKKDLKIGVLEHAEARHEVLKQFAYTSGISYTQIDCNNEEDLVHKYENNEVDTILLTDLTMPKEFYPIAKFTPTPFYFITTKGNTQIISELNQAQVNINKLNPTLSSDLYNRYFNANINEFQLNISELNFLKEHREINVLLCSGASPIRYGVGKDILEKLATETGITFHYTYAKTFEDCKRKALTNQYEIVLGLPFEFALSEIMNIHMSDPFLSSNVLLITNKDVSPNDLMGKKQGLLPYNITPYDSNKNLYYYETAEEIFNAVNNHTIDYTYTDNYLYTYYMKKNNYQNLTNFNTAEYLRTQYAYGISKADDLTLLSIINKTIRAQKNDITTYIYKNSYIEKPFNLSEYMLDHFFIVFMIALFLIFIILYFIHAYYKRQLQMKKAVELEFKRYQMLSDLSGEISFTYDYLEDSMKISTIGLGKLADEKFIDNFTKTINDCQQFPDIMRIIAKYLMVAKDITCEEKTRMLHNDINWYQLSIKVIEDIQNNTKTAIYAVGKVLDIQKEKEEREQLRIKSETDNLTGILNRGAAQDEIIKKLNENKGLGALIMIDLDNFKDVNDSYGHYEGDRVLIDTAKLLIQIFKGHVIARLGGDEFIIYMDNITREEVEKRIIEVLSQVKHLPCMKKRDVIVSMSIGIVFNSYSKDFIKLVKQADKMLYEVKRNGRDDYLIYE